ncbi:MAG: iron ABC transporter substrate-binding protein [Candidatus Nanopelagicales bacterium]
MKKILTASLALVFGLSLLTGCASESSTNTPESITIYSGRSETLVAPLFEKFTEETGIGIEVRYGDSADLAAQIIEEGENRQADVFFSQDAGALGALENENILLELPSDITSLVADIYKSEANKWVGVSGRARVFNYNPERVTEVPKSVLDLMDPSWKGRIGIAPTNASFQAFVTALRVLKGDELARNFLLAMKENAEIYESNDVILSAVEAGQIDAGLINHYYWYARAKEVGNNTSEVVSEESGTTTSDTKPMISKIAWFEAGDVGNLVNVAGVGALNTSDATLTFIKWLLSKDTQQFFVDTTFEYPLVEGVMPALDLPALADIEKPEINLTSLSSLQRTLELLSDVGLL